MIHPQLFPFCLIPRTRVLPLLLRTQKDAAGVSADDIFLMYPDKIVSYLRRSGISFYATARYTLSSQA